MLSDCVLESVTQVSLNILVQLHLSLVPVCLQVCISDWCPPCVKPVQYVVLVMGCYLPKEDLFLFIVYLLFVGRLFCNDWH